MSDLVALKLCPFCGGTPEREDGVIQVTKVQHPYTHARCPKVGCPGNEIGGDFGLIDAEAWNTRAGTRIPAPRGAIDRLSGVAAFVESEIAKIERDERYHYPPANTDVNAALALIQMGMEARMATLKAVRALLQEGTGG